MYWNRQYRVNTFSSFVVCRPGFYLVRKRLASFFFTFLNHGSHGIARIPKNAQPGPFDPGCAEELPTGDYVPLKVMAAAAV